MLGKRISKAVQDVVRPETARDHNRQASACKLIDDNEHAERPPILGAIVDKVIGPDVIGLVWAQAHTRSIVEPETAPFWLFLWHFQPFPPPDAIDPLDVDMPTSGNKHLADAAIAVAAVLRGQPDDIGRQGGLVIANLEMPSLRRARLTNDQARATL